MLFVHKVLNVLDQVIFYINIYLIKFLLLHLVLNLDNLLKLINYFFLFVSVTSDSLQHLDSALNRWTFFNFRLWVIIFCCYAWSRGLARLIIICKWACLDDLLLNLLELVGYLGNSFVHFFNGGRHKFLVLWFFKFRLTHKYL